MCPGKFYLVDSGYPNRASYLLAPYKGVKYHLPEFRQGPKPGEKREVLNYLYTSLCNVDRALIWCLKNELEALVELTIIFNVESNNYPCMFGSA